MPRFFVPGAINDEQAEKKYDSIKAFVDAPIDDRRIYSLTYLHDGNRYHAEVGLPHLLNGEPVEAILKKREYGLYYVCTLNRGVARGGPILIGEHDVISAEDFDE